MPQRLTASLRQAEVEEVDRIHRFLTDAGDPNLLPRPKKDYEQSAADGFFYIVESGQDLIGAAGIFRLADEKDAPLEAGSCFVAQPARGFRLQSLLMRARIAAAVLFESRFVDLFTAVKPENDASRKNVLRSGFELLTAPTALLLEPCVSCSEKPSSESTRSCCCDFYVLPMNKKCSEVEELLSLEQADFEATLTNSAGDQLAVRYDAQFVREQAYLEALREFRASNECASLGERFLNYLGIR